MWKLSTLVAVAALLAAAAFALPKAEATGLSNWDGLRAVVGGSGTVQEAAMKCAHRRICRPGHGCAWRKVCKRW